MLRSSRSAFVGWLATRLVATITDILFFFPPFFLCCLLFSFWIMWAVKCCRQCGVAGGERVPTVLLGWCFQVKLIKRIVLQLKIVFKKLKKARIWKHFMAVVSDYQITDYIWYQGCKFLFEIHISLLISFPSDFFYVTYKYFSISRFMSNNLNFSNKFVQNI